MLGPLFFIVFIERDTSEKYVNVMRIYETVTLGQREVEGVFLG